MKKITCKNQILELLNDIKKYSSKKALTGLSGKYWKHGYGRRDMIWYNEEKKVYMYNYYDSSGGSQNLNDAEMNQEEIIEHIWRNRKTYNRDMYYFDE